MHSFDLTPFFHPEHIERLEKERASLLRKAHLLERHFLQRSLSKHDYLDSKSAIHKKLVLFSLEISARKSDLEIKRVAKEIPGNWLRELGEILAEKEGEMEKMRKARSEFSKNRLEAGAFEKVLLETQSRVMDAEHRVKGILQEAEKKKNAGRIMRETAEKLAKVKGGSEGKIAVPEHIGVRIEEPGRKQKHVV